MTARPKAVIFDVFGTLVDWRRSIAAEVAAAFPPDILPISPEAFADHWRALYQPSMTPIRTGKRPYQPLQTLHRENLAEVLDDLGLSNPLNAQETSALVAAWERLHPWPDVPVALQDIGRTALIAPCSNGSIALMARLARFAGFNWDMILGADLARTYKPEPEVYRAAARTLDLPPGDIMMVAAHNEDLQAAAALGFQTGFFPRPTEHGPAQTTDLKAEGNWTLIAKDLSDMADQLSKQ